jgi:hypothetical protein
MAIDTTIPRTRRALLFGGAGALAALAAHGLGRPTSVSANDPNDVVLGGVNTTTTVTSIENTTGDPFATNDAILGKTHVQGAGVRGVGVEGADGIVGETDYGFGVVGKSSGPGGIGVIGSGGRIGVNAGGHEFGVVAHSPIDGPGAALYGRGYRGGRFIGKKAQIRLQPSKATTHPSSGAAGDLFVDASKRLWFCKGGTSWVRLG